MTQERSDLRIQLVHANHILVHQGVLDAFGHVSVRSRDEPATFFLSRNRAPALVGEGDIQRVDRDGVVVDDPRPSYLERFIHAEIYRARPDVMAVVHSHSPAVVPFTIADRPLQPVMHMAGFLAEGAPTFEIRDAAGDATDLLIRSPELGRALADVLGHAPVALMRGHGSVAVGSTLQEAVYRAIYTEVNARTQAQAIQLGQVTHLTAAEGAAAAASNATQILRAWEFWLEQIRARHPDRNNTNR